MGDWPGGRLGGNPKPPPRAEVCPVLTIGGAEGLGDQAGVGCCGLFGTASSAGGQWAGCIGLRLAAGELTTCPQLGHGPDTPAM